MQLRHWFDGLAMLHSFRFDQGQVIHSAKILQSQAYKSVASSGNLQTAEFGSNPDGFLNRLKAVIHPTFTDNGNVNVMPIRGQIAALTETTNANIVDPETLETVGPLKYDDTLPIVTTTAHPHRDADTGEIVNVGTIYGARSTYVIYKIPANTCEREVICELPVANPAYIHSFAMTKNYVLLFAFPLTVNPLELKFSGKPYIRNYRWHPDSATRVLGINRHTGRHAFTSDGPAMFSFHQVNAFEDGDKVVADMLIYPDAGIIDSLYLAALRAGQPICAAKYARFEINTSATAGTLTTLAEFECELPQINYRKCNTKPYQYMWAASRTKGAPFLNSLVKFDLHTNEQCIWFEQNCYPGEPIFVAHSTSESSNEDDGVILSVVLNTIAGKSFLLALDANSMNELARAELPFVIPFSFHGAYLGGKA